MPTNAKSTFINIEYNIVYNMKQYAFTVDENLIRLVDEIVKETGLYHSRNDFVRDALRSKVLEFRRALSENELEKEGQTAGEFFGKGVH